MRIGRHDAVAPGARRLGQFGADDQAAGAGGGQQLGQARVDQKTQFAGLRAFQRRQARDLAIRVAEQFAAQGLDDGSDTQGHGRTLMDRTATTVRGAARQAPVTCRRSAP